MSRFDEKTDVVTLQGRKYILFKGLVKLAQDQGLCGMKTEIIQFPSEENNHMAIVAATARFRRNDEVEEYTDIGDAAPYNVGRNIKPHLLRMASTRAMARALRIAVGSDYTAFEELNADDRGYIS